LQQFQDIPEYAVRFLPHAYLPIEAMCGKGDFAIIDENPISALFGERQIDARLLKNKARLSRMADAPNRDQWADDGLEERDPEAIIERAADVLRASLRNGVSTAAIVGQ
jgi:hypothetical protein